MRSSGTKRKLTDAETTSTTKRNRTRQKKDESNTAVTRKTRSNRKSVQSNAVTSQQKSESIVTGQTRSNKRKMAVSSKHTDAQNNTSEASTPLSSLNEEDYNIRSEKRTELLTKLKELRTNDYCLQHYGDVFNWGISNA
jgi:hypothetical protein